MNMKLVAVYGTLMRGFGNWRWALQDKGVFIGCGSLRGFTMLNLGSFPGIVPSANGGTVRVEVFEVPEKHVLNDLDRLEGHPRFYERKEVEVTLDNGDVMTVEAYVLPVSYRTSCVVVKSGDWRAFRGIPVPKQEVTV